MVLCLPHFDAPNAPRSHQEGELKFDPFFLKGEAYAINHVVRMIRLMSCRAAWTKGRPTRQLCPLRVSRGQRPCFMFQKMFQASSGLRTFDAVFFEHP